MANQQNKPTYSIQIECGVYVYYTEAFICPDDPLLSGRVGQIVDKLLFEYGQGESREDVAIVIKMRHTRAGKQ